jgi:hypothetical protein
MAEHYVRSAYVAQNPVQNRPNITTIAYIFHMLRCAGWQWVWEGDGEEGIANGDAFPYERVNHIPDGNMEAAGVASWTVTGAGSVAKDTSVKQSGSQSLRFDAQPGDLLTSAAWTNILPDAAGPPWAFNPYDSTIMVYNNSGQTFQMDIVDPLGAGSIASSTGPVNLPSTGGWAYYHVGCLIENLDGGTPPTFSSMALRITAPGVASTIYIDWALGFTSQFEWAPQLYQSASDGDIQNGNEFASGSYSFVVGDVGKFICAFDAANPENTGIYEIIGISGTNAVLDLRMGGNEVLVNTVASTIVWRMVYYGPDFGDTIKQSGNDARNYSGWMLESPDASKQRLMMRGFTSGTGRYIYTAGSPEDCDVDPDTGEFRRSGRSSIRNRTLTFGQVTSSLGAPGWRMQQNGIKLWMIFDGAGKYVLISTEDEDSGAVDAVGCGIGFTGPDANHPAPDDWVLLHATGLDAQNAWDRFGAIPKEKTAVGDFTMINEDGYANPACLAVTRFQSGGFEPDIEANAGPSPFTGDELLYSPVLWRDPDGQYGHASEKDVTAIPIWWGRANMTNWTPFAPITGTGDGATDTFAFAAGIVTLTDNEALFTPDMVGREITVSGATSPGNDGTFVVASYISPTQITYANATGVSETLPLTCTWSTSPQYIHISRGMVWKWNGFTAP